MCDLRTSGIRSQTEIKEHQIKKIKKREKGQTGVEWGGGGYKYSKLQSINDVHIKLLKKNQSRWQPLN